MRMTALCAEPIRAHCYRGSNHTGTHLEKGETFELVKMKEDEQGTKRLKVKARDGTVGYIRAKAAHTRPKYRVLKRGVVREGQDRQSGEVGEVEKGMVIVCEESSQEWSVNKLGVEVEQTRVRFEHNHVSGWVSVHARDGSDILQLMGL